MAKEARRAPIKCLVVVGTIAGMGGAERQALYLIEELVRDPAFDVEVLSFQDGSALRPRLLELGVLVHVVEYYHLWSRGRRARALGRMARLIRSSVRPDAILPFVGIHSKAMALLWPYTRARYCWWNQQDEGRDLNGTAAEKRLLLKVSHVVSNSWAGRDFLVDTYSLPADAVLVYNNGTPLPSNSAPTGLWQHKPEVNGRPIVTMLANVSSYKDHKTLLHAWTRVAAGTIAGLKPVLILAGSLKEAAHVTQMKNLAFDLGLSASDVMFAGSVDDVSSLLADSDLIVHSSVTEGCPNSVCEAMAMGRAVVATDIPGCRQALGETGGDCFSPPGDAETMGSQILRFLAEEPLRKKIGEQNRARIEAEFSIAAMNRFFIARITEGLEKPALNDRPRQSRSGSVNS